LAALNTPPCPGKHLLRPGQLASADLPGPRGNL